MTDYIDRQAAIDAVMALMPSLTTADGRGQFDAEIYRVQELFVDIGQVLNDLPSAEAEPVRHGKWVELRPLKNIFVCSLCGQWGDYHWNYCPNCGTKMGADVADKPYSPKCSHNIEAEEGENE